MHEMTYWVGVDTPDASPEQLAEFNEFYSTVHVPEVMANNPGFTSGNRYELTAPDPRGDFGPRWLARYTMDADSAERYVRENTTPGYVMPYTPFPAGIRMALRWRLLWSVISTAGQPSTSTSDRIHLIGMDPASGSTDEEVAEFNRFYDSIHVHEALRGLAATYVTRYELARSFTTEGSTPPRFAAVYEFDPSLPTPEPLVGPPTDGPVAWEQRNTQWRLGYTRIPQPSAA